MQYGKNLRSKRIVTGIALFMAVFSLVGCAGREAETPSPTPTALVAAKEREEIRIDFPFYDSEEYELTLAKLPDVPEEYELMLYDGKGEVLQQIPCGKLTEPIRFSFDGIAYGTWNNLEIFPAGLLFIWKDGRFLPEAIEIPEYEEARGTAMLTVTEDKEVLERRIYLLNETEGRTEMARSATLQRDTGRLTLRDHLEGQNLFEGIVRLDGDGNPVNQEYFDLLLWNNLSFLGDWQEDPRMDVWISEEFPEEQTREQGISSFEDVQNYVFGNDGHAAEYESMQAFLEAFGLWGSEPFFQYFDPYGNLQLELYGDASAENVCGIAYTYRFNSQLEKVVYMKGFTVCEIPEAIWETPDLFVTKTVDGRDGSEWVEDYEESIEYTDQGRPDYFISTGKIDDWSIEDQQQRMVEINYIYREDGTLYCRDYDHNGQVFGTTLQTCDSYYDEQERIVFETGYITHGHVEYYYIYEEGDTGSKPAYILYIDHNLNYAIPSMVKLL